MNKLSVPVIVLFSAMLAGCGASYNGAATQAALNGNRLTVGTVQKNIRKGMTAAEVAQVLGSPNIVTSGDHGAETWVYDKIATDKVNSDSSGYWFFVVTGGTAGSSASSTSQRTLTIVITFDKERRVTDLAYNSSRF
ncbi:MAG: outer membrane protein assembly factor BamE domain-containing protein [Candidatus Binataceae bacterium]